VTVETLESAMSALRCEVDPHLVLTVSIVMLLLLLLLLNDPSTAAPHNSNYTQLHHQQIVMCAFFKLLVFISTAMTNYYLRSTNLPPANKHNISLTASFVDNISTPLLMAAMLRLVQRYVFETPCRFACSSRRS